MKYLMVSILFAVLFLGGVGQIKGESYSYSAFIATVDRAVEKPAVAAAAPVPPRFSRTVKTVKWTGTICSNESTKSDYTMHLVSREEIADAVSRAGFKGESIKIAVALAYAEGQADLTCQGDWNLANNKWQGSVGLWQIRAVRAEQGRGSCRDLDALNEGDIDFQAKCAYTISGGGVNWSPWSAYTNGKYRKYL